MSHDDEQKDFQKQQAEILKKAFTFKFMTKEARERLNRIRLVKPEIAERVELALMQAIQSGQMREILSDNQLKEILQEVSQKKDFHLKTNKK
jgi:programmed cell death protein 5